ncbi:MAG: hypothetical protein SVM86_06695 [Candidatus Cloacimonadota bacterium]|nr:hypothetical protein [Candidatus Cloacimonadota bacterium]
MKGETFITQLVVVLFGSMLLTLSAQFSFPLKPIPFTLQSIVVVV